MGCALFYLRPKPVDTFPLGRWKGGSYPSIPPSPPILLTINSDGSFTMDKIKGSWTSTDNILSLKSPGVREGHAEFKMDRQNASISDGIADGLAFNRTTAKQ